MLQTLTDITDEEIRLLTSSSVERLTSLCDSEENIKSVFGVTIYNNNKSYLQQAIDIYPSLLNDTYLKDVIRDIKNRLIKMYKACKTKGYRRTYKIIYKKQGSKLLHICQG